MVLSAEQELFLSLSIAHQGKSQKCLEAQWGNLGSMEAAAAMQDFLNEE